MLPLRASYKPTVINYIYKQKKMTTHSRFFTRECASIPLCASGRTSARRAPHPTRALWGGSESTSTSSKAAADAAPASAPQQFMQGAAKTLEKFDMVTAPPGRADMGTKIIDTIADAGVPMVFAVAALAVIADQWEKRSGKKSSTVRALFFDEPSSLSQDEDNVVQRVISRLGTPSTTGDVIADKGLDLIFYRRPESILTYKEQLQLRDFFREHVASWRARVQADEVLKEDDFKAMVLLDQELMAVGRPEVARVIAARNLNASIAK